MEAKNLSITQAIKFGFSKTLDNLGLFATALVLRWILWVCGYLGLGLLLSGGIMPLRMMLYDRATYSVTNSFSAAVVLLLIIGLLIIEVIDSVICLGMTKITFEIIDGHRGNLATLFSQGPLVIKNIVLTFLFKIMCGVGYMLLIIPGVIWSLQFGLSHQALVDKRVGALEALRISSSVTRGARLDLLGLNVLLVLINFAGALCFGLGLLITMPLSFFAYSWAYRQLLGQTPL